MERNLGWGMRSLLGLVGAIALVAGIIVGVTGLRWLSLGAPPLPTFLAVIVCGLVVAGGATVLRGAVRGRITVRRPSRRRTPTR